jgi:hypothetical protein
MSDYDQSGNRFTAIFLKRKDGTLIRLPYDKVRFNVDQDPNAPRHIVPRGDDAGKIFEYVWITDTIPWKKKVGFDGLS